MSGANGVCIRFGIDGDSFGMDVVEGFRHESYAIHVVLEFDGDVCHLLFHIGHHLHVLDVQFLGIGLQFNASCDAVPVALRLVGDAVGVLSHAYVLDAVIDFNSDDVATSHFHVFGHIIDMRGGK